MGIYDREYFQKEKRGGGFLAVIASSAVYTLVALNVVVFLAQLISDDLLTLFLAASPAQLLHLELWRIVTAFFAHSTHSVYHILWNMLFLVFFGKELENIYGRRDFYIIYFAAGILSIAAEATLQHFLGNDDVQILGASGAVMAIVVLFTLFYPWRQILFLFFIPAPVWVLCAIYIAMDVINVLRPAAGGGVASLAHLTGAAVGAIYWMNDLRWERVRRILPARRRRLRAPKVASAARPSGPRVPAPGEVDPVSQRIDDLLGKISSEGKESLTEEEWEFLKSNSGKYRR